VEELPVEISRHTPDILHISAHANDKHLSFANASGTHVQLTGEMLRAFVDIEIPPRLVYLNACNSRSIAAALTSVVPMAIGTTAPIANRTARAGAFLFYDRLLSGASVQNAFEGGQSIIEALQSEEASSVLFTQPGILADREWLHHVPRLLARFAEGETKPDKDGYFSIETGVHGCPKNTTQLVLFTDDESFIADADDDDYDDDDDEDDDDEDDDETESYLAEKLCRVIRSAPIRQIIWSEETVRTYGDYRNFAVGVTGGGALFTATSMLCEAVEAYYRSSFGSQEMSASGDAITAAIAHLRLHDGSLAPSREPLLDPPMVPISSKPRPIRKSANAPVKRSRRPNRS
jgi:hypothetical protein